MLSTEDSICFPLKITQNVKCNIDANGCISVYNVCYRLQIAHMQMLKALHPWLMFIMYMGSTENLMRSHHEWPESPSSCWNFIYLGITLSWVVHMMQKCCFVLPLVVFMKRWGIRQVQSRYKTEEGILSSLSHINLALKMWKLDWTDSI